MILPWSPTPTSPSLLYFSSTIYIYIGLLPPCLILDVSVVDWFVNVVRRTFDTNHPSPFFPLTLCDLPFRMPFPLLPAYFKPRAIPLLPSLDLTSIVCTNSVSLSLCHSHSLLAMIVAILCIYPCLITMHVMYSSLLIDVLCVALCVSLSFPFFAMLVMVAIAVIPKEGIETNDCCCYY